MTVNKSPFMYLCSYLIPGGSGFEPAGIFLGGLSLVLGTLVILNCSLFCVFLYVSHNFVFCVLSLDIHGVERVSVTITVKSKFKRKCCYTWTSVNALLSHLRLLTLHLHRTENILYYMSRTCEHAVPVLCCQWLIVYHYIAWLWCGPTQISLRPVLAVAEATSSAIELYIASLTEVLVKTGSMLAVKKHTRKWSAKRHDSKSSLYLYWHRLQFKGG